jgi:hypothetical protein
VPAKHNHCDREVVRAVPLDGITGSRSSHPTVAYRPDRRKLHCYHSRHDGRDKCGLDKCVSPLVGNLGCPPYYQASDRSSKTGTAYGRTAVSASLPPSKAHPPFILFELKLGSPIVGSKLTGLQKSCLSLGTLQCSRSRQELDVVLYLLVDPRSLLKLMPVKLCLRTSW